MAKILVADDNSNIQRMVGLALKDQGIDVIAVGNGEAAVRKISELRPDLVLADVFMPVRNGYEVCQYVKEDEALKHIPVILLVGAFDPLDEQEAQRVGADGVLKKPFVPPDPLIAMVKAALERAGISLSPAGATKTAPVPARKAADLLPLAQSPAAQAPPVPSPTPQRSSPLAGISFSGSSAPPPIMPVMADESFVDEPAVQAPVNAEAASHTIAFGNLLGSTAPAVEDPGFSAEDMEAVTAKDWRSLEETVDVPEEEEEESKESAPLWRRDESASNFGGEDGVGPVRDWRDSAEIETVGRKSAREVWEQAEEKDGVAKVTDLPSAMASFTSELSALEAETTEAKNQAFAGAAELEAATQAPSHATTFVEEAPLEEVTPAPEITAMSLPGGTTEEARGHDQFVSETQTAEVSAEPAPVEEPAFVKETPAPVEVSAERTEPKSATDKWFSTPSSPWDTDAQQAQKLAASWDGGSTAPESGAAATAINNAPETHSNGESSHEEVTAVLADEPAASVSATEASASDASTSETPAVPQGSTSEAEMDALIARVMAKLNPEALNAMAQQILKPAVAAILADELKSKK